MWGENENKIPGLDITIAREEDVLTTTLFGTKTFGGVYFNFESDPPVDYKKVLIKNLLLRAYNICWYYTKFYQEIIYLKSVFQMNEFPLFFYW